MTCRSLVLFLAQGFGVGRAPLAPGTLGSLLGLGWFALLLGAGSEFFYAVGTILGIGGSICLSTQAERMLGFKDPSSIVVDEIVAIPVCFVGFLALRFVRDGHVPGLDYFFGIEGWVWTVGIFVAFRVFDIAKPWPVRQTQSLAGGWGVTVDDLVAALYVNACAALACYFGF